MVTERSKEIWRQHQARLDDRVIIEGRLVAVNATTEHGTSSTYGNWACRCEPCTKAQAERMQFDRVRRAASRVKINGRMVAVNAQSHGTSATYSNWSCRCLPCVEAHRIYRSKNWKSHGR